MGELPYFVELEQALDICKRTTLQTVVERVGLDDCHNRILAMDLPSKVDDPPFDNSAMDGFAMRYEDTTAAPSKLEIIGTIQAAGQEDNIFIKSGQAVRIMTGAPLPKGADSILQVELTSTEAGFVTLQQPSIKHFIRKKGENLTKGEVALSAGAFLTPSRVGLCATMGHSSIPVIKRLKIAIISTGDELKQPGQKLERGEIYESNSFGISGLVKWLGHEPTRLHCVGDTLDDLRKTLNSAAKEYDLILTNGGVSMGEWDLVRKIMEDEGDLHFWRVKLRPGSPPLFGTWNNTPIFGLPGNPVSSHVVFRMLVAPWIRNATMANGPHEPRATAKLATKVKSTKDCLTLRRVSIESGKDGLFAHQKIHQGSGNIASMALSEALVILQPGFDYSIGDTVEVILL
ncbi:MAG: molybdopterin molybdotransferase MoeA [Euryarchaeota archaeon]|mgnify:FL=1|jgi:molybdopterin molybdotransferase|nr:molybdopterin molybdotransferase MoeA [Euryarchaeota archaeon]